jgi:hypothetical protein
MMANFVRLNGLPRRLVKHTTGCVCEVISEKISYRDRGKTNPEWVG